jgi:hypothetical protein
MPIWTIQSPLKRKKGVFYSLLIYWILLFFLGLPVSASATTNNLQLVARFEGASLFTTVVGTGENSLNVVRLNGSFLQMGRQYGGLLGAQMQEFYTAGVDGFLIGEKGWTYTYILQLAEWYYSLQPQHSRDFISGMAATSGMTLDQQKITAALQNLVYFSLGCSSLVAWSDYTGGGPLVIGRNFDTPVGPFRSYAKYLNVVVYNPVGGGNSLAEVNYVGCVGLHTGMNKYGIYMDYHNGRMSDSFIFYDRTLGEYLMFSYLLNYSSLDRIDQEFNSTLPEVGAIITAADKTKGYVYEWATWAAKRRVVDPERVVSPPPIADGLLVSTNHFVDPTWVGILPVYPGATSWYTIDRRVNLLTLGGKYKGSLGVSWLKYIFDSTFWDSYDPGPTFPDTSIGVTNIQVIAVPANLELWVKARGYSNWLGINLKPLFFGDITPITSLLLME